MSDSDKFAPGGLPIIAKGELKVEETFSIGRGSGSHGTRKCGQTTPPPPKEMQSLRLPSRMPYGLASQPEEAEERVFRHGGGGPIRPPKEDVEAPPEKPEASEQSVGLALSNSGHR